MALHSFSFGCILLLVFLGVASSSPYLSDGIFDSHGTTGRTLLQAKKKCTVDFENKNYTIITSQCKGPQFRRDMCCVAFKQFACPFVDELNDPTADCANTMFSYINLYGKYPPGLFSNMCAEGKDGLDCDNVPPLNNSTTPNAAHTLHANSPYSTFSIIVITTGFLGMFLQFF